jgi:hypothetical protein
MDQEVLVVANTNLDSPSTVYVIVDITLNSPGTQFKIFYSNKPNPQGPSAVRQLGTQTVSVLDVDGSTSTGPINCVQVTLAPLEAQILGR